MGDTLGRRNVDALPHYAPRPRSWHPHRVVRIVAGIVLAGIVSGVVFLTIAQEAFKKGYTDHRFNGSLGILLNGHEEQIARRGLYGTLAIALVMALAYWPLARRVARPTLVKGAGVGVAGFLGWGLGFGPWAASKAPNTVPAGLFGLDADAAAPVVLLIACLAGGITLARVFDVVTDPDWWHPREVDYERSIEALVKSEELPIDDRSVAAGSGRDADA